MLPAVAVQPRTSDFHALHAIVWADSPFAGSLSPLDPYIAIFYWFQKIV